MPKGLPRNGHLKALDDYLDLLRHYVHADQAGDDAEANRILDEMHAFELSMGTTFGTMLHGAAIKILTAMGGAHAKPR